MFSYRWTMLPTAVLILFVQQVPTITLSAADRELPRAFSDVKGIRELTDGRVIVVDSRELLVQLVDFERKTATIIGRQGPGPGEYRIPQRIFALPGDSSAVYDMANSARPLVITSHGRAGGSLPLPGDRPLLTQLSATDARGRIYSEVGILARSPSGTSIPTDSAGIERLDRTTGRRDTIARVSKLLVSPLVSRAPRRSGRGATGADEPARRSGTPPPFASHDQWAVAPDERVAVVSVDPYRVTFTGVDGLVRIGPVLDVARVPVGNALKDVWRAAARQPRPVLVSGANGQTFAQTRVPDVEEPAEWPDYLPPFLSGAVAFAPDGMLWVRRAVAAESAPAIDVIDQAGRISRRIVLPKQTKLVGFGASSVYLVRIDADDLQYLQRYPLPR
jgi:hypothetical protein